MWSRCRRGECSERAISAVVSASGEIRPKNYVNIDANAFGKIIKLYVKEGDQVPAGQMLAQIENVQPRFDVAPTCPPSPPPGQITKPRWPSSKSLKPISFAPRRTQEHGRLDWDGPKEFYGPL